ncbi:MAG: helix-turn-helix domain-containing protein [Sterolibacterium sp.]|jgi:transcriptional regulator with XRE-family HTH domain|nr:helix-turn-helix domain-containing protein [Sterolibacterium sp.]
MDTRRKELGEFLQAMRQRCAPAAYGFPLGSRRRTQGLRREEVAQLAQISATWYTWMEQGRDVRVSADVLDRLTQALRLTATERAYLFEMAGRHDPNAPSSGGGDEQLPQALVELIDGFEFPAYIMGRYWDVLGWNQAATHLFNGWLDQARTADQLPPNLLRFVFLLPLARGFVDDWEARARRICAEFRADCRAHLDDPVLQTLIDTLAQGSEEFARFWKQHDVLERQGGQRGFRHPEYGLVTYQQFTLRPVEQEHFKLVLLKPLAISVKPA